MFHRLRKGRFDAVWVFGYSRLSDLQAIAAAKLLGLPVILRAESNLRFERSARKLAVKRLFFRLLRSGIDCVAPIGELNRRYWEHYFGDDFPAFPTPYAVDNAFFQSRTAEAAPQREGFRRELGCQPGLPVILYASKLLRASAALTLSMHSCVWVRALERSRRHTC